MYKGSWKGEGKGWTIVNPATGEAIEHRLEDSSITVQQKHLRAAKGQRRWAAEPLALRKEAIQRFGLLLRERCEELAGILTEETGKPISQARQEINAVEERIHFFLTYTGLLTEEEVVYREGQPDKNGHAPLEERISYEPLGVIANISAWNYPYFVGSNVFVPALLTGNAVLYKPSEYATRTGLAIARLLWEAGVPEDVFLPVVGGGDVGALLTKLPLQGIFFTGSYRTGLRVAQAAATKLGRLQLELGGKDAAYVCSDVDIEAAVASLASGAFYNTGQGCCSVERIYVQETIYERFVRRFVETVQDFRLGDPRDEETFIGPLTRPAQMDLLLSQVHDALALGATLKHGGRILKRPGFYFEPTVLTGVHHGMKVMREESFGPMVGIQAVSHDEEALRWINDTDYGLTAGIYTPDYERARRLLAQVDTGSVYWNCSDRISPHLPWSGRRNSGVGTTLSYHGIRTFLQPKAWHLRPTP